MRNQISTIFKMSYPLHFGVLKSTKLPYLLILTISATFWKFWHNFWIY